ncbi:hypothetical protein C8R46DRAFT_275742 [Mycena filopes]|nr:hypothetical protein C8R46DRAFT_275742 [Mycena filopes]
MLSFISAMLPAVLTSSSIDAAHLSDVRLLLVSFRSSGTPDLPALKVHRGFLSGYNGSKKKSYTVIVAGHFSRGRRT